MMIGMKQLKYICLLTSIVLRVFPVLSAEAAIRCYQCHGTQSPIDYRPLDDPERNASTGGFQGNHRTHMGGSAIPITCNKCHPGSDSNTSSHRDGLIKVSSHINTSPQVTPYKNGTSAFLQKLNPTPGTCSNVNCHFESTTPNWGNPAFSGTNHCTQCHEGSVALTTPHATHKRYSTSLMGRFSTYTACATCHANYATPPNFIHATSAGSHPINVSVVGYSSGSRTYLPSQPHGAFGTCTNLYCHSPGNKSAPPFNAPVQTATWGTILRNDCSGCHKGNAASFKWMSSGSHIKHVYNYYQIDCVKCHALTVTPGLAIKDLSKHVNGTVEISFNSTSTAVNGKYNGFFTPVFKTPGSAYGSCASTYCHSDGTSVATGSVSTNTSPVWGSGTIPCTGCHAFPPAYTNGSPKANSHTKHAAAGFGCNACHAGTTADGMTITSTALHVNRSYDLSPGAGVSFAYVFHATGSTCSNISCHNSGTAVWGATLTCGDCHTVSPGGD